MFVLLLVGSLGLEGKIKWDAPVFHLSPSCYPLLHLLQYLGILVLHVQYVPLHQWWSHWILFNPFTTRAVNRKYLFFLRAAKSGQTDQDGFSDCLFFFFCVLYCSQHVLSIHCVYILILWGGGGAFVPKLSANSLNILAPRIFRVWKRHWEWGIQGRFKVGQFAHFKNCMTTKWESEDMFFLKVFFNVIVKNRTATLVRLAITFWEINCVLKRYVYRDMVVINRWDYVVYL